MSWLRGIMVDVELLELERATILPASRSRMMLGGAGSVLQIGASPSWISSDWFRLLLEHLVVAGWCFAGGEERGGRRPGLEAQVQLEGISWFLGPSTVRFSTEGSTRRFDSVMVAAERGWGRRRCGCDLRPR